MLDFVFHSVLTNFKLLKVSHGVYLKSSRLEFNAIWTTRLVSDLFVLTCIFVILSIKFSSSFVNYFDVMAPNVHLVDLIQLSFQSSNHKVKLREWPRLSTGMQCRSTIHTIWFCSAWCFAWYIRVIGGRSCAIVRSASQASFFISTSQPSVFSLLVPVWAHKQLKENARLGMLQGDLTRLEDKDFVIVRLHLLGDWWLLMFVIFMVLFVAPFIGSPFGLLPRKWVAKS